MPEKCSLKIWTKSRNPGSKFGAMYVLNNPSSLPNNIMYLCSTMGRPPRPFHEWEGGRSDGRTNKAVDFLIVDALLSLLRPILRSRRALLIWRLHREIATPKYRGRLKGLLPGFVNASGKARQKWEATAGTKFTKPGVRLLAECCTCNQQWRKRTSIDLTREYRARLKGGPQVAWMLLKRSDRGGEQERE